jgi:hypothetical protein
MPTPGECLHRRLARRLVSVRGALDCGCRAAAKKRAPAGGGQGSRWYPAPEARSAQSISNDWHPPSAARLRSSVSARAALASGRKRPSACQRFLSRISRNSFGPLRSLRLRACRSSSGADGSIRRSNAWPAISRAFAGRLERTGLLWPGRVQHRNDRLAMIAYDIGGVVVVPAPAGARQRLFSASFAAPDQGESVATYPCDGLAGLRPAPLLRGPDTGNPA